MTRQRNIKKRGDVYSMGGDGYTLDEAMLRKLSLEQERRTDKVTVEINVYIMPMGNNKYKVVDDSTYESNNW